MGVTAQIDNLARVRGWTKTVFGSFVGCVILALSAQAALSATCKPNHFRPPFFINTMGACAFDPSTLSFAGDPVEQAKCLMRGMDHSRNLAPPLATLPSALESRVGNDTGLPSREALSAYLSKQNLEWDFAAYLWQPLSRANDNDPNAPMARYFVIHDTSGPNYGHRSFPADVDGASKINNLHNFACADGWGKAHIVVNRAGGMLLDHELAIPWRETRFEQAANFAGALKGLFLHVELVQPRRSAAGRGRRNDAQSPDPAFTAAQYDRLALVYVIASVRARHWLIPAFHAAIDANIRNGHDDPLNFDVASFANSVEGVVQKLQGPEATLTANSAAAEASDATPEPDASAMAAPEMDDIKVPIALVNHDAAAPRSAETTPQSASETKRNGERTTAPANETASERKSNERATVSVEHCTTHVAKGHRRRVCRTIVAVNREHGGRGRRAHAARSVDHRVSHQSARASHHAGDLRARHERAKARHGRA